MKNTLIDNETAALPCVLFLDDDERILRALRSLFRWKYDVIMETDGNKALEQLKERQVHLVVCDQRMPGMTGVEFLRKAKIMSPNTMRILLTAYSDLNPIVSAINDGEVFSFIQKPWDHNGIQQTIAEAVEIGVRLFQAVPPAIPSVSHVGSKTDHAILTLSRSRPLYLEVSNFAKDKCEVLHAKTLREAFLTLQARDVAVIIAESAPDSEDVGVFLKLAKHEHPEIATMLVTPSTDAQAAIDLINHAQLFRFLIMPVSAAMLKSNLEAALQHAESLRAAPTVARRNSVDPAIQIQKQILPCV